MSKRQLGPTFDIASTSRFRQRRRTGRIQTKGRKVPLSSGRLCPPSVRRRVILLFYLTVYEPSARSPIYGHTVTAVKRQPPVARNETPGQEELHTRDLTAHAVHSTGTSAEMEGRCRCTVFDVRPPLPNITFKYH